METKSILGVNLNTITRNQAKHEFLKLARSKEPSLVATVNTEFVMLAQKDEEFFDILDKKSDLNLIDGAGLLWAIKFSDLKTIDIPILKELQTFFVWFFSLIVLPLYIRSLKADGVHKISGSDFVWDIAKLSAENNLKVFILGYSKGLDSNAAEKASLYLQTKTYGLRVSGVYSGTESMEEEEKIVNLVKKSDADVLLVGFGSPRQEKWIARNLEKTGAKVAVGLGGTFDFIIGAQKRAPKWMQKAGLEWLYRLLTNPKRIKRQLAIPKMVGKVLFKKIKDD